MWLVASKAGIGIQIAEPESPSISLLVFRRKTDFHFSSSCTSPKEILLPASSAPHPLSIVRGEGVIWGNKGAYDNDIEHGCEVRVPALDLRFPLHKL